jgi:hypothetical protein
VSNPSAHRSGRSFKCREEDRRRMVEADAQEERELKLKREADIAVQ